MSLTRIEKDTFGDIEVPADMLYGAQTQRSLLNFNIAKKTDRMPMSIIHALAIVKSAAAVENASKGKLDSHLADAIVKAVQKICRGELDDHFPLVVWQTGSGTQSNMNVNEVIANYANQMLGHPLGGKKPIHPNDHVNMGQSSNDIFPTAVHISVALGLQRKLIPALNKFIDSIDKKCEEFANIVKIGRTHMQDAVPLTFGQEFSAYSIQLKKALQRIQSRLPDVCELAIGGTAVGTGLNSVRGFDKAICDRVTDMLANKSLENGTKLNENRNLKSSSCATVFKPAENKFEALSANDAIVDLSGTLNTLACSLMKISNDIRLLGSGPRCGLGELLLPENEPGSSIMPGKVNPTQCEALSMVCCQVMGNHVSVTVGGSSGHLQLNVYRPMIANNVLHSIDLLSDSIHCFVDRCFNGIAINHTKVKEYLDRCLMLVTALAPKIGYEKAADVAKYANEKHLTLREAVVNLKILTAVEFDNAVRPEKMLGPK